MALLFVLSMIIASPLEAATDDIQQKPPVEVPAFLAHLPKYELKLDTLTGCGLIDSASIGPGATVADLRIGRDSLEEVVAKLERRGAKTNASLGYRGYSEDLPIAVVELPGTEVWLRFNALRVLYRITYVFASEAALADARALVAKEVPALAAACPAQETSCNAKQAGVSLQLQASAGAVTLSIASIPLDEEARNTEKLIDADIRRKRAGSARGQ